MALGLVFLTQEARAADLYVPAQYSKIQSVINAAANGDRIIVSAGTYKEAVSIYKNIALIGQGANQTTIIRAGLSDGNTITFDGSNVRGTITGFTITGASGNWPNGNGIYCKTGINPTANPTITNNTISENSGVGIGCYNSSPTITNNTISGKSTVAINPYIIKTSK